MKKKTFLFLYADAEGMNLSMKLPHSGDLALALPFTAPTGYGLGKSGWVSASFAPGDDVPLDAVRAWIDESYRAIAPKKIVASLDGPKPAAPSKARKRPTKSR